MTSSYKASRAAALELLGILLDKDVKNTERAERMRFRFDLSHNYAFYVPKKRIRSRRFPRRSEADYSEDDEPFLFRTDSYYAELSRSKTEWVGLLLVKKSP